MLRSRGGVQNMYTMITKEQQIGKKRGKYKGLKYYEKRAWERLSRFVRLEGCYQSTGRFERGRCYTCDHLVLFQELDAGHAIGGRNNAVLFDKRIIKPQCQTCNRNNGGEYEKFKEKLIKELGEKQYYRIVEDSKKVVLYSIEDLVDVYEKYNDLICKILN